MGWRRISLVLLGVFVASALESGGVAEDKADSRPKATTSVEAQGIGVVRLPAEGARLLITLRLRMPTLKEVTVQEERIVAKLEDAWKQWKTGTLRWRLLDQQLQALRQADPDLPASDFSELPVVGYVAWRVYQLEITGLPVRDLQEAVRELQKVALQHGAIPGVLPRPTPLGGLAIPNGPVLAEQDELLGTREVVYFVAEGEAAYQEALKKAQANALAKVQALTGNRTPLRVSLQEIAPVPAGASGIVEMIGSVVRYSGSLAGRATERVSITPEVEIVASVKVICEF